MSTRTEDASVNTVPSLFDDLKTMRVLRFAFGVTLACALAYGINWPLAFLMPVFTAMILAMPLPKPSVKASLNNMMSTLMAFVIGLSFSLFFLQYPIAYLIVLALVLFHLARRALSFGLYVGTLEAKYSLRLEVITSRVSK